MPYRFEILFSGPLGDRYRKEAEAFLHEKLRIETRRSPTTLWTGPVNAVVVEAHPIAGPANAVDSDALLPSITRKLTEWGKVPLVATVDMKTGFVHSYAQTSIAQGELRKLIKQYARST